MEDSLDETASTLENTPLAQDGDESKPSNLLLSYKLRW